VPVPPGIFAIWDGMGLVAKRIEHEPNSDPAMVVIKSVNPEYQTYQRTAEEVNIIGRVRLDVEAPVMRFGNLPSRSWI
jgi:hypothetical protein